MIVLLETIRDYGRAVELDVAHAVSSLQASINGIVQAELRRFQSRLHSLTPYQQQLLEESLRDIGTKILVPVIRSLKRAIQQGDWQGFVRLCELLGVVPLPHMEDLWRSLSGLHFAPCSEVRKCHVLHPLLLTSEKADRDGNSQRAQRESKSPADSPSVEVTGTTSQSFVSAC